MASPFTFKRPRNRYEWLQPEAGEGVPPANGPQPFPDSMNSQTSELPPIPDLSATDYYQTNRKIRPKLDPAITDPMAQEQDYERNLRNYEPDKAGWKKWLPFIINSTLAGGGKGGLPGMLGGLSVGVANKFIQPDLPNKLWKQREQAQTSDVIGDLTKREDSNFARQSHLAQIENLKSEVEARKLKPELDKKRADQAEHEKRIANLLTMHDRLGHYRPDDLNDKGSQAIRQQAEALGVADQFVPYETAEKAARPELVPITNEDGTTTHYERQKDGTFALAKGLPVSQPKLTPSKPEPDYGTRADFYYKRQKEKEAEVADLDGQLKAIAPAGQDAQGNPAFTDDQKAAVQRLTSQREAALKDANDFRTKGDDAATMPKIAPRSSTGASKPDKDGKYHYTTDQIRAKAEADGVPYEQLLKVLQGNKRVVIDQ